MLVQHDKGPIPSVSLEAIAIAEVLNVFNPGHVTAAQIALVAPAFTVQQEEIGLSLALGIISPQEARLEATWATEYATGPVLDSIIPQPTMAQDIVAAELIGQGATFHLAFG
jgi:hypothetical protein